MRFDGFHAEEQLGGDLGVGLAGDDKPRDLQLTLGERLEAAAIWYAGPCAPVDVIPLLSQFALRLVALAYRAAGGEAGGGVLELGRRAGVVAGLRICPPGEHP